MRLWSLHPRYLDPPGLTALWREGLLARKVLRGETRGYTHHPQLERFRAAADPLRAIEAFLSAVLDEAERRGYAFDASKLSARSRAHGELVVTDRQLDLEWRHLRLKLQARDPLHLRRLAVDNVLPHPLFRVVVGPVEPWERAQPAPTRRRAPARLHST